MDSSVLLLLGALAGGGLTVLVLLPPLCRLRRNQRTTAAALRELGHDLRGALSPGLLLAERLESHPDAAVRQSAAMMTQSMERTAALAKTLSSLGRARHAADQRAEEPDHQEARRGLGPSGTEGGFNQSRQRLGRE